LIILKKSAEKWTASGETEAVVDTETPLQTTLPSTILIMAAHINLKIGLVLRILVILKV